VRWMSPFVACAVERRRFPVGATPPGERSSRKQPESHGNQQNQRRFLVHRSATLQTAPAWLRRARLEMARNRREKPARESSEQYPHVEAANCPIGQSTPSPAPDKPPSTSAPLAASLPEPRQGSAAASTRHSAASRARFAPWVMLLLARLAIVQKCRLVSLRSAPWGNCGERGKRIQLHG
jgi:hypothetical protein